VCRCDFVREIRKVENLLLIHPVVLSRLPGLDLALLEPERDLLLGVLDAVAAVADVAANVLFYRQHSVSFIH
jgi:hypothetical protein